MARFDILGLQYFTDGGELLGGGKLNFYETGTTTRKDTFSDAAMTIANTNPVTLDADGRAPNIFFAGLAKCVLTDSTGAILETRDPVGDDSAVVNAFAEWVADRNYSFNEPVTGSNGYIYTSLINNNLGNDPLSEPLKWQLIAETIGIPDSPNGNILTINTANPQNIGSVTPASLQSIVHIQTQTINNVAVIDFIGLSHYSQYMVVYRNVFPVVNATQLQMRTSSNNGATFDSGALNYRGGNRTDDSVTQTYLNMSTFIPLTTASLSSDASVATGCSGSMHITRQASQKTTFTFSGGFFNASGGVSLNEGYAYRDSTTQINAIRFLMSTGNLSTGTISVYGIRTS